MKLFFIALAMATLVGCTHTKVSDISLLEPPKNFVEHTSSELTEVPVNISTYKSCYSRRSGNLIRTTCSPLSNIRKVTGVYEERGLKAIPANKEEGQPKISLSTKRFNWFLRGVTEAFNFITLGILPRYDHRVYTLRYQDPSNDIDITEKVKVSWTQSWISLLIPNRNGLSKSEMRTTAEKGLIRKVLDKAEVK